MNEVKNSTSKENIFLFIKRKGNGASPKEICKATKLCSRTVSKHLKSMVKEGLIHRNSFTWGKKKEKWKRKYFANIKDERR